MSKIDHAIRDIHGIDAAGSRGALSRIHPLVKLLVTFWFLILVLSFPKYDLAGPAGMSLYLIITIIVGEISVERVFPRLCIVFLPVLMLGIVNPFFDRTPFFALGSLTVTGGMISMLNLWMKAALAVIGTYVLTETTRIEDICYAMQLMHLPSVLITQLMLTHRYLILMLKEAGKVTTAYSMRAPGQKGIHYKAWGSLAGRMLLGSMDRADIVYESMLLRGFDGRFRFTGIEGKRSTSILYGVIWFIVIAALRFLPVFRLVGGLFG